MFKSKIVYKLIGILLVFGIMIIGPYSFTIIKHMQKMLDDEEALEQQMSEEYSAVVHREFTSKLIDRTTPFIFYITVMAFIMAVFFLRNMLMALRNLKEGAESVAEGNFDKRLPVISEDELGDVTRSFNAMAEALRIKTEELNKKDMYIQAMIDPLWVADTENIILDVNPAFTRLFGYERDEALGASVYDFLDDENAVIMKRQIEKRKDLGESSIYELKMLSKGGIQVPVLISGSPIYSGENVIAMIGIIKDFREQRSLRDELQRSLDYIESIMNSIPDSLVVLDREYRIIMANSVAAMNSDQELVGKHCYGVLHGSSVPCWTVGGECPSQFAFSTGKHQKTVHAHMDETGKKIYHEIISSPVKDAAGNVIHVVELLRDVTDRVRNEEQYTRKNKELAALNSISSILSRSLKPDEIFMKVLDRMIEMLSMDGGGIFFIDESSREMACKYHKGISDEYVKMIGRVRVGDDLPGMVAATGDIIASEDISRDARGERSVIRHSGIRGYCCFPVKGKETIIGVFCLFSFSPRPFNIDEEKILISIGDMTGMAFENIRLYEKMKQMYEHQRNRLSEEHSQLLDLSTRLGAAIDISEIMKQVLELMKNLFKADFAWMLSTSNINDLKLMYSSETGRASGDTVYSSEVSCLEKYALTRRLPVFVSDLRSEERFFVSSQISLYRAAVAVPMFIGEKPVGVFSFYYTLARDFREDELHFMEILANMISVALERSEFYIRASREKEFADTILQSVNDAIITVDRGDRVLSVNSYFSKLSGIDAKAAAGSAIYDIFGFSSQNEAFCSILKESIEKAKRNEPGSSDSTLFTPYGGKIAVSISSSPIFENGVVTGVVNLLRDVSRESELNRMKTELVRSVSHEFRTPLSSIIGMTEMILSRDVEGERIESYLNIIRNEGIRLAKMVSELLSIARIESGKETLKLAEVDLAAIVDEIRDSMGPELEKNKARIDYESENEMRIIADEEKIRQLLRNLIDNSLTFSDEGCKIIIKAVRRGSMNEISVIDNGWGIPDEDMPHLSERFYRGRHGEKVKGTGLGLALCQDMVKMHGGTLDISSRLGSGTTITIRIPQREVA